MARNSLCPRCVGSGALRVERQGLMVSVAEWCPDCDGSGHVRLDAQP